MWDSLLVWFGVQTCRDLKDRQQLLAYRSKVDKGSAEEEKIAALLSSTVSRAATLHSLGRRTVLKVASSV